MQTEDLAEMNVAQVIWGWPHCVQYAALMQIANRARSAASSSRAALAFGINRTHAYSGLIVV
jgi:hypothetical protein